MEWANLAGMKRVHHYPAHILRDHARPRNAPAPLAEPIDDYLTQLVRPATYALADQYRQLGLRWRVLSLPAMVALVLSLIWRQVASVSTLVRVLAQERLLWEPPRRVTQQALSLRLRTLPAELFLAVLEQVLPELEQRVAARRRPRPAVLEAALGQYTRLWVLDVTTLEALFKKVGLLRQVPGSRFGGRLAALLDLGSKLPVRLWHDEDAAINEKRFLEQVKAVLVPGALLLLDRGFYAFPFFDWLTVQRVTFVTRQRHGARPRQVERVLAETPRLRDRLVRLGQERNPCQQSVRLIEVLSGTTWHSYLTNELDPARLSAAQVVELYGYRWRIEEVFLLVKRLLGLAYLWTGATNGLRVQLWATWLLYAALVDLADAVAEELNLPLERISLEMVFRSLYFFAGAYARHEATDAIAYLAAHPELGIVKRQRKLRAAVPEDLPDDCSADLLWPDRLVALYHPQ